MYPQALIVCVLALAAVAVCAQAACEQPCFCYNCPSRCGFCDDQSLYRQFCRRSTDYALTFDDGPSEATPELLRHLRERNITATFYLLGKNVQKYPQYVRDIVRDGHMIAPHGFNHINLTTANMNAAKAEIYASIQSLKQITGELYRHYRFGYGEPDAFGIVASLGMSADYWSADTKDWKWIGEADQLHERSAAAHVDYVFEKLTQRLVESRAETSAVRGRPGLIHLQHDRPASVAALPRVLDWLLERQTRDGYRFVTMDTCTGVPEKFTKATQIELQL